MLETKMDALSREANLHGDDTGDNEGVWRFGGSCVMLIRNDT